MASIVWLQKFVELIQKVTKRDQNQTKLPQFTIDVKKPTKTYQHKKCNSHTLSKRSYIKQRIELAYFRETKEFGSLLLFCQIR